MVAPNVAPGDYTNFRSMYKLPYIVVLDFTMGK